MTLKIARFMTDAFNKQAKISHFDFEIQVGRPDKMLHGWKQKILDAFGELFLNDANYVIMTKAEDVDEKLKKQFKNVIEKVLDTEVPASDVKVLDLGGAEPEEDEDGEEDIDEGDEGSAPSSESVMIVKLTTK